MLENFIPGTNIPDRGVPEQGWPEVKRFDPSGRRYTGAEDRSMERIPSPIDPGMLLPYDDKKSFVKRKERDA